MKAKLFFAIAAAAFLGAGAQADERVEHALWRSNLAVESASGALAEAQSGTLVFFTYADSDQMAFDFALDAAAPARFLISERTVDECNSVHYVALEEILEPIAGDSNTKGGVIGGQDEELPEEQFAVARLEVADHTQRTCDDVGKTKIEAKYFIDAGDRMLGELSAFGDFELIE